jgi:hypothetical protein
MAGASPYNTKLELKHNRHLRKIDLLMARTACLVCLVGTVSGHHKNALEKAIDIAST